MLRYGEPVCHISAQVHVELKLVLLEPASAASFPLARPPVHQLMLLSTRQAPWHTGTRTTAPTCAHLHVRTSTATFSRGPLLHQDVGPLLLFLSSCACFDSPPSLCNLGWENGLASTSLLPLCVFSRLAIASSPFSSSFENRRSPFFFF